MESFHENGIRQTHSGTLAKQISELAIIILRICACSRLKKGKTVPSKGW